MEKEIDKFMQKARSKNFEYFSLSLVAKQIEVLYKYLNNYDAFRCSDNLIIYMEKFLSQLYGIEVKMPKEC